ncbi:hypothetical protein [Mesorhizobium sp. YM1C-6-2]|uniref:hypothetical protein n=1 Tax=Mesorhizobium sp. YM1C-6-2 TaxID=1827501 RepID=UPI0011C3C0B2|nr:hypothetical protein [Mesorhizobium sp. YM1C-6-2]
MTDDERIAVYNLGLTRYRTWIAGALFACGLLLRLGTLARYDDRFPNSWFRAKEAMIGLVLLLETIFDHAPILLPLSQTPRKDALLVVAARLAIYGRDALERLNLLVDAVFLHSVVLRPLRPASSPNVRKCVGCRMWNSGSKKQCDPERSHYPP